MNVFRFYVGGQSDHAPDHDRVRLVLSQQAAEVHQQGFRVSDDLSDSKR